MDRRECGDGDCEQNLREAEDEPLDFEAQAVDEGVVGVVKMGLDLVEVVDDGDTDEVGSRDAECEVNRDREAESGGEGASRDVVSTPCPGERKRESGDAGQKAELEVVEAERGVRGANEREMEGDEGDREQDGAERDAGKGQGGRPGRTVVIEGGGDVGFRIPTAGRWRVTRWLGTRG